MGWTCGSTSVNCEPPQSVNDVCGRMASYNWASFHGFMVCHIDLPTSAVVTQIGNLLENCPMTWLLIWALDVHVWHLLHWSTRAWSAWGISAIKCHVSCPSACDITILYHVGMATMDMHKITRKRQAYLLKTVLQSCSLSQLSNQALDCNWQINYLHDIIGGVTSIVKFRIWETKFELLPSLGTRLPTGCLQGVFRGFWKLVQLQP